jgi:hypothetical protein
MNLRVNKESILTFLYHFLTYLPAIALILVGSFIAIPGWRQLEEVGNMGIDSMGPCIQFGFGALIVIAGFVVAGITTIIKGFATMHSSQPKKARNRLF